MRTEMQIKKELDDDFVSGHPHICSDHNVTHSNSSDVAVSTHEIGETEMLRQQISNLSAQKEKIFADYVDTKAELQRVLYTSRLNEKQLQLLASNAGNLTNQVVKY